MDITRLDDNDERKGRSKKYICVYLNQWNGHHVKEGIERGKNIFIYKKNVFISAV